MLRLGLETNGFSQQDEVGEKAGCSGTWPGSMFQGQTLGGELTAEVIIKQTFFCHSFYK